MSMRCRITIVRPVYVFPLATTSSKRVKEVCAGVNLLADKRRPVSEQSNLFAVAVTVDNLCPGLTTVHADAVSMRICFDE